MAAHQPLPPLWFSRQDYWSGLPLPSPNLDATKDWSWNSNTLATSCEELTHWKRLWRWEGLGAGGEGDDRGWDGWMASLTRWTWVWVNSGSWWWTGRPGVLQFMGSQRVRHDWATELNWTKINCKICWNHFNKAENLHFLVKNRCSIKSHPANKIPNCKFGTSKLKLLHSLCSHCLTVELFPWFCR